MNAVAGERCATRQTIEDEEKEVIVMEPEKTPGRSAKHVKPLNAGRRDKLPLMAGPCYNDVNHPECKRGDYVYCQKGYTQVDLPNQD